MWRAVLCRHIAGTGATGSCTLSLLRGLICNQEPGSREANEEAVAHTSVLSPDAGCLASVVSKVPFAWELHCRPVPQRRPDGGAFACLACNQRRHRGFR
jgi:hypothetical protein